MSEANDAILEELEHALGEINYNVPPNVYEYWAESLRTLHTLAPEDDWSYDDA